MADPLSPDTIAQRTFGQRLRGFNPDEVRAYLEEVALAVGELQSRSDALHTRLLELGNRDLTAEFDLISEDVGRILQDAREAAEGMRKRAAGDAEILLEEANTAAIELRTDAWMASDKLLQDSAKEAAAIIQAAERASLVITSEAEREAHHRQSATRRESEETVRTSKLEAERVQMEARARSDELILDAGRKVAAAEERAAAMEERRTEMLAELENARVTISNLEGEIEKRREALAGPSPEEVESSTVKLLTGPARETDDEDDGTGWAEGHEVVKIVRPPKRIVEPPSEPVDAEAMAAEVARLRSPAQADIERVEQSGDGEEEALGPEPGGEDPAPVTPGPTEEVSVEGAREVPNEDQSAATGTDVVDEALAAATIGAPTSAIDDLFARLRLVEEQIPPATATPAETVDQRDEDSEPPVSARPSSPPDQPGNLFDARDRSLLPVTNRVLRAVKRELTEAQNIALEELRVEEGNWEPDAATLVERLVDPIGELLSDSYAGGWASAAEVTETELVLDGDRQGDPAEWTGGFAEALTKAVSEALSESHRDGRGPRQAAASLSRVYRLWRTDEAERRVRDIAGGAYHRGLIDGFGAAGLTAARWVVSGRGCTVCREAAEAGPVLLGAVFEDSVTEPPAHHDCGCTLTPA
jgi:DivIVA domain-containing protein